MVIMASGIACGRVCTKTATAELPNMAAILQKMGWQRHAALAWFTVFFFDIGRPCYDQLTPVETRYLLTSIMWPYRGLKLTAHQGHMFLWSWQLTKCWLSDWIAGSCQVNFFNIGQDCSVAGLSIKSLPNYKFSSIWMFCAALFCVYGDI